MRPIALVLACASVVALAAPAVAEEGFAPLFTTVLDDLALGIPEVTYDGPCTASLDCGDGNTISCSGNSTCSANSYVGYVECDGNRTYCPNQCQLFLYCGCNGCWASCISTSGNCQQGPGWIRCNGYTITCDRICSKPGCSGPPLP